MWKVIEEKGKGIHYNFGIINETTVSVFCIRFALMIEAEQVCFLLNKLEALKQKAIELTEEDEENSISIGRNEAGKEIMELL